MLDRNSYGVEDQREGPSWPANDMTRNNIRSWQQPGWLWHIDCDPGHQAFPSGSAWFVGCGLDSGGFVKTVVGADLKSRTIELKRETSAFGPRALRTSIMTALGNGDRRVVVDCCGWERLDLVVLSALVQGAKACAAFGASFELVNLDGHVRDDIIALRLERRLGLMA